jgi:hypothetical protein
MSNSLPISDPTEKKEWPGRRGGTAMESLEEFRGSLRALKGIIATALAGHDSGSDLFTAFFVLRALAVVHYQWALRGGSSQSVLLYY